MSKKLSSKETVEQILLDVTGAKGFRNIRTNEFRRVLPEEEDNNDIFEDFWEESSDNQGKDTK